MKDKMLSRVYICNINMTVLENKSTLITDVVGDIRDCFGRVVFIFPCYGPFVIPEICDRQI